MFQTKLTVFSEEEVITLWHEPYGQPGAVYLTITDPGVEVVFDGEGRAVLFPADVDNLIEALSVMRDRLKGDKNA